MSLQLVFSAPAPALPSCSQTMQDAVRIMDEWKSARMNKESITQLPTLCASLVPLNRRIGKTADALQYALDQAFTTGTYRVEQFELHHPVMGNSRTVFYVAPDDMDTTVIKGHEAMQYLREVLQGRRDTTAQQHMHIALERFLGTPLPVAIPAE